MVSQGWTATDQRLAAIAEIQGIAENRPDKVQKDELLRIDGAESYTAFGLKQLTVHELFGWHLLLSRSQFKRSWVMQGWILSQHAVFICDGILIDPLDFMFRIADL